MSAAGPRSTLSSTGATRTAAATAARRTQAARRAAVQLAMTQLDALDDDHLVALAVCLLGEARRRGLEVPDPDEVRRRRR